MCIRDRITSKHDIATAFDGITYGKGSAVLTMVETWLGRDKFQAAVRKLVPRPSTAAWTPSVMEQIKDQFERVAPPDPQEEFHRAIRRLKVLYNCTFEDGEHAEEEDEEGEEPSVGSSPSP